MTLSIAPEFSINIKRVRKVYNPIQFALIKSHVTLCREDELFDVENSMHSLSSLSSSTITLEFEIAIRFSDGKGVLLPVTADSLSFHYLRKQILMNFINYP